MGLGISCSLLLVDPVVWLVSALIRDGARGLEGWEESPPATESSPSSSRSSVSAIDDAGSLIMLRQLIVC